MSFSDLLNSSRGPGLIGLVVAMLVLCGFGSLFVLSTQEGSGKRPLASIVRDNAKTIGKKQSRLEYCETILSTLPLRKQTEREIAAQKKRSERIAAEKVTATLDMEITEKEISNLHERFLDYKNQYRAFVRTNAEGTVMEKLETKSGETLHQVYISAVSAVGLEVRHRDGLKRVPFEDLPDKLQDYYQFDTAQKDAEMHREKMMRKKHYEAVGVTAQRMKVEKEKRRAIERVKLLKDLDLSIAEKRQKIAGLRAEIANLNAQMSRASASANNSRTSNRIGVNNSGKYRNRVAAKMRVINSLQAEITAMEKSKL